MDVKKKYYAVAVGRSSGVYMSWPEAEKQVKGYKGSVYKSFDSLEEANDFLHEHQKDGRVANRCTGAKAQKTDICLLCERPFRQVPAKKEEKKNTSYCSVCRKQIRLLRYSLYKKTNGMITSVSHDDVLYLKNRLRVDDIFAYLEENPYDAIQKRCRNKEATAKKALAMQRKSYEKDGAVKDIPLFIRQTFGDDREILSVEGDRKNPVITYHCKRCDQDFKATWERYKNASGHNCEGILSSGEAAIKSYLVKSGVKFVTQRDTLRCVNPDTGYVMPYDFELPDIKLLIEVQGEQHRRFVEMFHVDEVGFEYQKKKDTYKRRFAEKNGYMLLEIWYDEIAKGQYQTKIMDEIKRRAIPPA
jgi:very-short-patch-repair endonuclease